MNQLQKLLAQARIDLLNAQTNLALCRKCNFPQEKAIELRHRASDRVWELQCMCGGGNVQI